VSASLDSSRHEVFASWDTAAATFTPGPAQWFRAVAAPGTTASELRARIEHAFAGRSDVTVRLGSQERADAAKFGNRYFSIFVVVVLVALVVGLLGLANTLALTVFRRTRELGVLRAIGTDRRQLAGMILVESITLAAGAALLAVPLGGLMAALVIKAFSAEIGATIPFAFAWSMVPIVAGTALLLGTLGAWLPARRAGRVDPVIALRFD
jgi:putative ABC transport system permease protein